MNGSVVIDASLAVKWLVNEVHTDRAFALARAWARAGTQPVAPYLMPVEVANALYRRALRGDISVVAATTLLDGLLNAGIELREPRGLHRRAMELAAQLHQEATYDAHYLSLADIMGCELWTADERFYRAASPSFKLVKWIGEIEVEK